MQTTLLLRRLVKALCSHAQEEGSKETDFRIWRGVSGLQSVAEWDHLKGQVL